MQSWQKACHRATVARSTPNSVSPTSLQLMPHHGVLLRPKPLKEDTPRDGFRSITQLMVFIAKTSNKLIRIRGFRVDYLAHAQWPELGMVSPVPLSRHRRLPCRED
jgi:hypothetical protein